MHKLISTRLFPKRFLRSGLPVETLSACREDTLTSIFGENMSYLSLQEIRILTSFATNCRMAYREIAMSLDRFPS